MIHPITRQERRKLNEKKKTKARKELDRKLRDKGRRKRFEEIKEKETSDDLKTYRNADLSE